MTDFHRSDFWVWRRPTGVKPGRKRGSLTVGSLRGAVREVRICGYQRPVPEKCFGKISHFWENVRMRKFLSFVAVASLSVCGFAQEANSTDTVVSPADQTVTSQPSVVESAPIAQAPVMMDQSVQVMMPQTGDCGCGGTYTSMPVSMPMPAYQGSGCGCGSAVVSAPVSVGCGGCGTYTSAPVATQDCGCGGAVQSYAAPVYSAPVSTGCGCAAPVSTGCGCAAPVSTGCGCAAPAASCCPQQRVRILGSQPVRTRFAGRRGCGC